MRKIDQRTLRPASVEVGSDEQNTGPRALARVERFGQMEERPQSIAWKAAPVRLRRAGPDIRIERLSTTVTIPGTPGNNGCMGMGAVPGTPERRENTNFYVAVFEQ